MYKSILIYFINKIRVSCKKLDQAVQALEKAGIPLIALGRELIVEPEWVGKVEQGREQEIKTTLHPNDQARLQVPDPLWELLMKVHGWFPVEDA
jgi:2,4-dienoyl-CoA reductase-like NADH-dependent reductase (Old Yellow Enzyme family)